MKRKEKKVQQHERQQQQQHHQQELQQKPVDYTPAKEGFSLYWANGSIPSMRVLIYLYEKKIPFKPIRLKVMAKPVKETRLPEFLAINPRGKTPTLVETLTGDNQEPKYFVLYESQAILNYLERRFPEPSLVPQDIYDIGLMHMRQAEADVFMDLDHSLDHLFEKKEVWEKHIEEITASQNAIIREAENLWERYLSSSSPLVSLPYHSSAATVETTTSESSVTQSTMSSTKSSDDNIDRFLVGTSMTLADCAFFPVLAYFVHHGFPIKEKRFENLCRYRQLMRFKYCAINAWPRGWGDQGKNLFRSVVEFPPKEGKEKKKQR